MLLWEDKFENNILSYPNIHSSLIKKKAPRPDFAMDTHNYIHTKQSFLGRGWGALIERLLCTWISPLLPSITHIPPEWLFHYAHQFYWRI